MHRHAMIGAITILIHIKMQKLQQPLKRDGKCTLKKEKKQNK